MGVRIHSNACTTDGGPAAVAWWGQSLNVSLTPEARENRIRALTATGDELLAMAAVAAPLGGQLAWELFRFFDSNAAAGARVNASSQITTVLAMLDRTGAIMCQHFGCAQQRKAARGRATGHR